MVSIQIVSASFFLNLLNDIYESLVRCQPHEALFLCIHFQGQGHSSRSEFLVCSVSLKSLEEYA